MMLSASVGELAMREALSRMQAVPNGWLAADSIRRTHLTIVRREDTPRLHLIEGDATPTENRKGCRFDWEHPLTLALFIRDDAAIPTSDPFKIEILRRMDPYANAWANGVTLKIGRVRPAVAIADADSLQLSIDFTLCYSTKLYTIDELPDAQA